MEYPSYNKPPAGSIRFNTDSSKMEIYNGEKWWEIDSTSPYEQTGGTRGLWGCGETPGALNTVEYANLDTTGNFIDFGDLTQARAASPGAAASRTRAFWAGGQHASTYYDNIDYVTISSTGAGLDFGNLQNTRRAPMTASNEIRGVILAGTRSGVILNVNDMITIATTGNAIDFSTSQTNCNDTNGATMASPTRGVFAGGYGQPGTTQADCNYITFMTQGKQADFGDLTATKYGNRGTSNAIRGIVGGGITSPAYIDTIEYFTLATLGNATTFGELTKARAYGGACGSPTRGVFVGGYAPSPTGGVNIADYVQLPTTGNAVDFGDIGGGWWSMNGTSNGHGGLG